MLELDDIQGNILAGFNTNFQVLVGLAYQEGADWQGIAQWLADRASDVTTVTEVRSQRESMKAMTESNELTWLCLSLSERVMANTQPDVLFSDDAFRRGMVRRAGPVLGDKTPPKDWKVGGLNRVIDVLLIVGSNNRPAAEARANQLVNSASPAGLLESCRETAARIEDLEHFGFRDGISQPRVVGSDTNGEFEAGHFVYGYPKLPGGEPIIVQNDPRGVTRNGSLLVLRRLEQNVERFRSFCDAEANRIKAQWPELSSAQLQALLVGRWPLGALVSTSASTDPGQLPDENNFDFSDDGDGLRCPFGAHIRKVNPRNGPKDVVDVPRFLRRGIPFGPRFEENPDAKRGLLFISFQTSIVDTFEFTTAKWMNVPEKPGPHAGHDMLVGRSHTARSLTIKSPHGPISVSDGGQQWVMPTGGAYLFSPSRSGLAKFVTPPQISLKTRVVKRFMQLTDYLARD
jgi:Dyp-type peroxidase family